MTEHYSNEGVSLKDEQVQEFKRLYKEHYDTELTDAQAYDKGYRLVRLLKVVLIAEYEARKRTKEGLLEAKRQDLANF